MQDSCLCRDKLNFIFQFLLNNYPFFYSFQFLCCVWLVQLFVLYTSILISSDDKAGILGCTHPQLFHTSKDTPWTDLVCPFLPLSGVLQGTLYDHLNRFLQISTCLGNVIIITIGVIWERCTFQDI